MLQEICSCHKKSILVTGNQFLSGEFIFFGGNYSSTCDIASILRKISCFEVYLTFGSKEISFCRANGLLDSYLRHQVNVMG